MTGTVFALAGRRIDAAGAETRRFPLGNAEVVRERIREHIVRHRAMALVSSAACGADLLALEVAGELGLRRLLVLPFAANRFRVESVTDRPGGEDRWGPAFDRVLSQVHPSDVLILEDARPSADAFAMASERILDTADHLAKELNAEPVAVIVWDGKSRGGDDLTARFAESARGRGMTVKEISTL